MKERAAKADDSSKARAEQALAGELCYILENTVVKYKLAGFGELC
jgi:hypothetical protein